MKSNIIQFGNFFHKNNFYNLILSWFKENQRPLYWRRHRSIYLTYLTEVMLQQTTVRTVENKLKTYLETFPDFKSYKNINLNKLLNSWSGLGYYRRAENFYSAIKIINKKYDGNLPREISLLKSLPGIGSYTANAILAIGYNIKAFPIDVNVRRLILRIVGQPLNDNEIEEVLREVLKKKRNFRSFYESMMDFSSLVCKKQNPLCKICTFQKFCNSAYNNFNDHKKIKVHSKKISFYLFEKNNAICFIHNPNFKFYKNFLHLPSNLDTDFLSKTNLIKKKQIKKFNYSITNNKFVVIVYLVESENNNLSEVTWVKKNNLSKVALPSLFKKILN